MRKALLVARWEFIATITRRAYIFAVVAMPLFYGGMLAVGGLATRLTTTNTRGLPIAIVDRALIMDLRFAAEQATGRNQVDVPLPDAQSPSSTDLVLYDNLDRALAELRARKVAGVFLIGANYLATGSIAAYSRDAGLFSQQADRQRQNRVADAIRASLLRTAVSGNTLRRAYAPAVDVKRFRMDDNGGMQSSDDAAGGLLGSIGVFYLLLLSIFFSAGFLQQATAEDRQNRMLEILLSSLDSDELLVGKLLGLGAAGLMQVGIYLLLIIVPGMTILAVFQVSVAKLLLSLVYFVIAYLLFACLMTGTGMLGRTPQESAQLSALWTLAAASPMFFIAAIGAAPNGIVSRALSIFPLTSPTTMMLRLMTGDVPSVDVAVSIAIGVVAIYAALRGASKIFRAASLMYGKRPTLPELVRWLRAA